MAVVSISKIQVRRGQKNTGSGIPQLASGEIGWAVDAQEMYIGNGSLPEGAPAIGNTQILTEHTNILDLVSTYSYKKDTVQTGATSLSPIQRSLQDRLDDIVSVRSFGATGDGTDQTAAFQRALSELYFPNLENLDKPLRIILYIPAGTYVISDTLELPSYVSLIGDGIDKTVIQSSTTDVFKTIKRGSNQITQDTQPTAIKITDMTVDVSGTLNKAMVLDSCADSTFERLKFTGAWTQGDDYPQHLSIELNAYSESITTKNNVFRDIEFSNFNRFVSSDFDSADNQFDNCKFTNSKYGIVFGENTIIGATGQKTGPVRNSISNSVFDLIEQQAIQITNGEHNISNSNKFLNVGNDISSTTTVSSIITFNTNTNVSMLDYFERTAAFVPNRSFDEKSLARYIPEINGRTYYQNLYANEISIGEIPTESNFLKLPEVKTGTIFLDYVYNESNNSIVREGTLELICNVETNEIITTDSYTIISNPVYADLLTFKAYWALYSGASVIDLKVVNNIPNISSDNFYFTIRTKS